MDGREIINKIERNNQWKKKSKWVYLFMFFPYFAGCHTKEFDKNVRKKL